MLERERAEAGERPGVAIQPRAAPQQPGAALDVLDLQAGALAQRDRVAPREPAQMRLVVDALRQPRPAPAGEPRERAPVADVGERDDRPAAGLEHRDVGL